MQSGVKTKLSHLKKIRLLSGLSDEEIRTLERMTSMESVKKRQFLYRPGDPSEHVFFLKSGRVKVSQLSQDGKEFTLTVLEPGEIFGEVDIFEGTPRDTVAEVLEDAFLCVMKKRDFEVLLKRNHDLTLRLTKMISLRLKKLDRHVRDLLFKDVPARLAHLLFRLSQESGLREAQGIRFTLGITHQEMANLIGSTRETITAILGDFKRRGLISLDGRHVLILREKELKQRAHPYP